MKSLRSKSDCNCMLYISYFIFFKRFLLRRKQYASRFHFTQNSQIECFLMFVSVPRSFLPALEMICEVDRERCQPKFAFTNLEMLPCGCPTVAEESSCTISCKLALVIFFILFCFYLLTCCLQVRFLLVKKS